MLACNKLFFGPICVANTCVVPGTRRRDTSTLAYSLLEDMSSVQLRLCVGTHTHALILCLAIDICNPSLAVEPSSDKSSVDLRSHVYRRVACPDRCSDKMQAVHHDRHADMWKKHFCNWNLRDLSHHIVAVTLSFDLCKPVRHLRLVLVVGKTFSLELVESCIAVVFQERESATIGFCISQ